MRERWGSRRLGLVVQYVDCKCGVGPDGKQRIVTDAMVRFDGDLFAVAVNPDDLEAVDERGE